MKLTLVFPYYKNPRMLACQLAQWRSYPVEVREALEIIVVDDGSPVGLRAEEVDGVKEAASVYRILVDLPWNMCGARNLGIYQAAHDWVLWCDIDHLIPAETLTGIMAMRLDAHTLYQFSRIQHVSREVNTPHKEIRLCRQDLFWNVGGFDESYCGHYAFSEHEFFHREAVTELETRLLPLALERVTSDDIPDCKTFGLVRKEGRDDAAYEQIRQWKASNRIGIERLKLPWLKIA